MYPAHWVANVCSLSMQCGKMSDYLPCPRPSPSPRLNPCPPESTFSTYPRTLCSVAKSCYLEKLSLLGLEEIDNPYTASNVDKFVDDMSSWPNIALWVPTCIVWPYYVCTYTMWSFPDIFFLLSVSATAACYTLSRKKNVFE